MSLQIVNYKEKNYIVGTTNSKDAFVVNGEDLSLISGNVFYKNSCGYIVRNNIYMHDIILPDKGDKTIDHINRITTDNRRENLRYATQSLQNQNKNKTIRKCILPDNCGIDPQEIPTFIYYLKPNVAHGDRFSIEIGRKGEQVFYYFRSSSSKNMSLKLKFEMTKKKLRNIISNNQEYFNNRIFSIKCSDKEKQLTKEYIEILSLANITYEEPFKYNNNVQENLTGLTEEEIQILHNNISDNSSNSDNTDNNSNSSEQDKFKLPLYCYYQESKKYFTCDKTHPMQQLSGKAWNTTSSKFVSKEEKYKEITEYLTGRKYSPIPFEKPQQEKKTKSVVNYQERFNQLSNEQLLQIMKFKNENKTTQEVSEFIVENYKVNIPRNIVSNFWQGKIDVPEELKLTNEFKNMILNEKERTKKTKFTDEEIFFIKESTLIRDDLIKLFTEKFGKTISKPMITKFKKI